MNVLVNGIGNIGTTLLNLLAHYKNELGIDEIYALKNNPLPWNQAELELLAEKGVKIIRKGTSEYKKLPVVINYVFDSTNNGGGMANKEWYTSFQNLVGACAQGSEKNFGTSYMSGINNSAITNEQFVHVVSCNTHSIASITNAVCLGDTDQIIEADYVIVRRSEDIGNHQRLVSANVVARHLDPELGTHHSIDVLDLYKTIGKSFPVTSSDITTPSQLMHGVRFNIKLKGSTNKDLLKAAWKSEDFISTTKKFDSNIIFELGRRYGFNGRLYSHAIVIEDNVLITENSVKGWAFIPQEGNTLISTLNAFLLQTSNNATDTVIKKIKRDLLREEW